MVERPAVNRNVVGSSPTSGANFYALVSARVSAKEGGVLGATGSKSVSKNQIATLLLENSSLLAVNSPTAP